MLPLPNSPPPLIKVSLAAFAAELIQELPRLEGSIYPIQASLGNQSHALAVVYIKTIQLKPREGNLLGKASKGRSVLILSLLLCLMFGALSCASKPIQSDRSVDSGDEKEAAEKVAEANKLYAQREDLSKVRLAIAMLRQARVADYGSYDAAWKLAKVDYYLGSHTGDERERDLAFREGIDIGRIAVQLQGNKPDGHFWLGANYGGSAEHSTLASMANVEDIRREMEMVLKIDEAYEAGSAYLVLGQLYLKAPRVLGGDHQKAIAYLEKGLRFGSNNGLLRLHLAEAYHAAGRDADARKQIDFMLEMTPDPNYIPEYKEAVAAANKMLEKINAGGK